MINCSKHKQYWYNIFNYKKYFNYYKYLFLIKYLDEINLNIFNKILIKKKKK